MGTLAVFEVEATVTDRGQTTVPSQVRKMLHVGKRDRLVFRGMPDGTVVIARKEESHTHTDPVISQFLQVLENDMRDRGLAAIRPIPETYLNDLRELSKLDIDLDGPLTDDEE